MEQIIRVKSNSSKFNFELKKNIFKNSLIIKNEDIKKSILAINMLCEYIRYCYFDDYKFQNKNKLKKYCRLILRYENCNQAPVIKHCKITIKTILNQAIQKKYNVSSIDLSLCLSNSNYLDVQELCETLMINSIGTHVRGSSF